MYLPSIAVLLFSACGLAFGAAADASLPTYHVAVSEVRLTFSATDRNNRVVGTIQPGDFAIVDRDLVVRNLRSFHRADYTRLEVVVVVDASASIRPQFPRELASLTEFIDETKGMPEESFSIVSFQNQRPTIVCSGNCRTSQVAEQLPAHSQGLTPLYDSILFATDLLAQRADSHARKVLVLFSDGEDTISQHAAADAIDAALAREIQIYAVDTSTSPAGGDAVLQSFANATGGRYFSMRDSNKLVDAVLEDFRASYTVTYQLPSRAAGYHDVRILSTRDKNMKFRCQRGYYYPGTAR